MNLSPDQLFLICGLAVFTIASAVAIICAGVQAYKEQMGSVCISTFNNNLNKRTQVLNKRINNLECHSQIDRLEDRVKELENERSQKNNLKPKSLDEHNPDTTR